MGERLDRQIAVGAVLAAGVGGGLLLTLFPDTKLRSVGIFLLIAGFLLLQKVERSLKLNRSEMVASGPRPNWLMRFMLFFGALAAAWIAARMFRGEASLFGPFSVASFVFCAYCTLRPARL